MSLAIPYRSVQRVYFDDLDALNILHNVRYLLFIERARGEFFNLLGFHWHDSLEVNPDKYHVIADHHIEYILPVRGEGDLSVLLRPTKLGSSSFIITSEVRSLDGAVLYARNTTRLVRLDPATNRSTPWSSRFREAMDPLITSG